MAPAGQLIAVETRMSESTSPVRPRGRAGVAWAVIVAVVGVVLWRNAGQPASEAARWLLPLQIQGRYVVGAADLHWPGVRAAELYQLAERLFDRGGYPQRLRLAVLAGELVGPERASAALADLERDRQAGAVEAGDAAIETAELLQKLYSGYEKGKNDPAAVLDAAARQTLRDRLGWFGELALAPAGSDPAARERVLAPARRTAIGYLVLGGAILVALTAGGFLLTLLALRLYRGRLASGLAVGEGHGGVYAETFAVYLVLYLSLGFALRQVPAGRWQLAVSGLAMLLSLAALGWPVLRGVPWRQVRRDLGLTLGERPLVELLCGPGCYLIALPLLVVGVLVMLALMAVARRLAPGDAGIGPPSPTHPIVGIVLGADWLVWLQVFVVAALVAPLVEEIFFRGALYRHLREATGALAPWASVTASVAVSAFVFAVIHPQGWFAVPVLMALATAFALAREWRGSLVAPVLAHAINNGATTLLLLLLAG